MTPTELYRVIWLYLNCLETDLSLAVLLYIAELSLGDFTLANLIIVLCKILRFVMSNITKSLVKCLYIVQHHSTCKVGMTVGGIRAWSTKKSDFRNHSWLLDGIVQVPKKTLMSLQIDSMYHQRISTKCLISASFLILHSPTAWKVSVKHSRKLLLWRKCSEFCWRENNAFMKTFYVRKDFLFNMASIKAHAQASASHNNVSQHMSWF